MEKEEKSLLAMKELRSMLTPKKHLLTVGDVFCNADITGDDDPKVGGSWKEYWKIFTKEDFPTTCPFCGKPLVDDDVSGCHIKIAGMLSGSWSMKKFIIPGHQNCNLKVNDEFTAKISLTAVEAIKK